MTTDHFHALGLRAEITAPLADLGYEEPTPIQSAAIPVLLTGRDLVGQAATGTGKTAAFALPLVERLGPGGTRKAPFGLILVPTRELAMQVSEAVHRYGRPVRARVLPIYGGQPIGRQLRELDSGVDVVVATPGRAVDHITRGTLDLAGIGAVVLDEADEMLDMGFAEDLETILSETPAERQTVLFSATMPARIESIARRHLKDPARILIAEEPASEETAARVRHVAYVVPRAQKSAALGRVLDVEAPAAALVFCRTREVVDRLTETLNGRGYRAEALHGGMTQEQRDRVMGRLRGGTADLLIATDVAARGLDVEQLTHVVNYDMPASVESYVHRMGRVGRAGREGVAITLAEPREHRMLKSVERATGRRIAMEKVPTVADLRARRLEMTRAALREALVGEEAGANLERFRVVVDALSDEFDPVEIAMAGVKLAHDATAGDDDDEEDIDDVVFSVSRADRGGGTASSGRYGGADGAGSGGGSGSGSGGARPRSAGMTRLYISVGRDSGVRPKDLVGALTGETALSGRQIGAIEISGRFSLVEVPDEAAADVIQSLRGAKIRGRKATVRRERY